MRSSAEGGARREAGAQPARAAFLRLTAAVAIVLVAAACDPTAVTPPARTSDPRSCPELALDPVPDGHRETARRRLLPDRPVSPLRVDYAGPGGRTLTLLSGQPEELGGQDLGTRQVAGHEAGIVRTAAGTLAAWWFADGDPDCPGYAVVADGYGLDEFVRLIGMLVVLGGP